LAQIIEHLRLKLARRAEVAEFVEAGIELVRAPDVPHDGAFPSGEQTGKRPAPRALSQPCTVGLQKEIWVVGLLGRGDELHIQQVLRRPPDTRGPSAQGVSGATALR